MITSQLQPAGTKTRRRPVLAAVLLSATFSLVGCVMPLESGADDALGNGAGSGAASLLPTHPRALLEGQGWTCSDTGCTPPEQPFTPDESTTVIFEPIAPDDSGPEERSVSVVSAALQTNETTVMCRAPTGGCGSAPQNVHVSEPDAVAYKGDGSGAQFSMNIFSNQTIATAGLPNESTVLHHACSRNYTDWTCQRGNGASNGISVAKGGDPTAVFESGGTNYLHVFFFNAPTGMPPVQTGFAWYRTTGDSCPTGCPAQTWTSCNVTVPSGVTGPDYPQAIYNPDTDKKYLVYMATVGTANKIVVQRINNGASCANNGWIAAETSVRMCAGSNSEFMARADYDNAGLLHIVYLDYSIAPNATVRYTTFNTNTSTWDCSTAIALDTYNPPAGPLCPGCNPPPAACKPTYTDIGAASSLRETQGPSIAVDSTNATWRSVNVAIVDNAQGLESKTKVFRRDPSGSWTVPGNTPSNAYQPRIAFAKTSTDAGFVNRYHLFALWDWSPGVGGSQVTPMSWVSSDGGQSWGAGITVGTAYTPQQLFSGSCYWGDYNALAPDRANTGMFYGWSRPGSPWAIRGRIMNE